MVVAQVDAELNRLKLEALPHKEWDEETVVDLKEEVLKIFYDVHGTATNQIQFLKLALLAMMIKGWPILTMTTIG